MRVDLLPRMVQIYLPFLILILFKLLPLLIPFFSKGDIVRVWSLLLIVFRRIPQRILLTNLLQLSRLVEKLIPFLLLVSLGCNMRRVTCVARPRVRVAALVFTSPLFWSHCQEGASLDFMKPEKKTTTTTTNCLSLPVEMQLLKAIK